MNMFTSVVAITATLWLVLTSFGFMISGPKGAAKVNRWIVRTIRGTIGGFFIWLGNQIK